MYNTYETSNSSVDTTFETLFVLYIIGFLACLLIETSRNAFDDEFDILTEGQKFKGALVISAGWWMYWGISLLKLCVEIMIDIFKEDVTSHNKKVLENDNDTNSKSIAASHTNDRNSKATWTSTLPAEQRPTGTAPRRLDGGSNGGTQSEFDLSTRKPAGTSTRPSGASPSPHQVL